MSKTICLVFVLVILTTILCNNSVCSQRGSWNRGSTVCGCKIHHNKGLHCAKTHRPKTSDDFNKRVMCICRNPKIYLNNDTKQQFRKMCNPTISIPL